MGEKKILDATCGSRMMWFNHQHPNALYMDCREVENKLIWESKDGKHQRFLTVKPDVLADFEKMPFEDESFYLVVFDPPHLVRLGKTSWTFQKYGRLEHGWEEHIKNGFWECMRVLKQNGTLIFKWNETDIPVKKIIDTIGCNPLFGHTSGRQSKTIWLTFMKGVDDADSETRD